MLFLFRGILLGVILILYNISGCKSDSKPSGNLPINGKHNDSLATYDYSLLTVAQSERLWTGVAVSNTGRIFVNYPMLVQECEEGSDGRQFPGNGGLLIALVQIPEKSSDVQGVHLCQ